MRVTEGMRYAEVQRNLARVNSQHADAARQATTGERIDIPSKDPIAAAEIARLRASLSAATGHRETIRAVRGDSELAESTLAQATDLMTRAREIAISGANGSLTAAERTVMAGEVRGLKDELVRLANTKGSKGYIFAGNLTDKPAFDANGNFQGDDGEQHVDIGGSTSTAVGASGARAFTISGGRNVFADLDALSLALDLNDGAASAATLNDIEASQKQLINERARVGLVVGRLDTSDAVLEQLELDLGKRQSDVGAVDPMEAYSRLTAVNNSLERSIAVSRQVLDLSKISRF